MSVQVVSIVSMLFREFPCWFTSFHVVSRVSTLFHECPSCFTSFHVVSRVSKLFHECPCCFMSVHVASWVEFSQNTLAVVSAVPCYITYLITYMRGIWNACNSEWDVSWSAANCCKWLQQYVGFTSRLQGFRVSPSACGQFRGKHIWSMAQWILLHQSNLGNVKFWSF